MKITLHDYLGRIGFQGVPRSDLATLRQIHRQHLAAIPYENLDVQLGRTVGLELDDQLAKLVGSRRGGWCYEMNGVMAWALEEVGFRVMRLAGAVARGTLGDRQIGTHLVLCVQLDGPYLVDVGFGDGLIEPVPIVAGTFQQDDFEFRLEQLEAGWWRFHNQPHGGAPNFDFKLEVAPHARLADRCTWLQTSPESGFVQNVVCQRYVDRELRILRGRVMKRIRQGRPETQTIDSPIAYEQTLADEFGIAVSVDERLWQRISARHALWLQSRSNAMSEATLSSPR